MIATCEAVCPSRELCGELASHRIGVFNDCGHQSVAFAVCEPCLTGFLLTPAGLLQCDECGDRSTRFTEAVRIRA